MTDHVIPSQKCPFCKHPLDRVTGYKTDSAPVPGDFTVCIRCARINTFLDDGSLKTATQEDLNSLDTDMLLQLMEAVAIVRNLNQKIVARN